MKKKRIVVRDSYKSARLTKQSGLNVEPKPWQVIFWPLAFFGLSLSNETEKEINEMRFEGVTKR